MDAVMTVANVHTTVKNAMALILVQHAHQIATELPHQNATVSQDTSMMVFPLNARNVMINVSHVKDLPLTVLNVFQKEDLHQSVLVSQEPITVIMEFVKNATLNVLLVLLMTNARNAQIRELHHQIVHVHQDIMRMTN
jgi:hypothetical protein